MTIRIQSQARASTTGLLPVYTTTLAWDPSRVPLRKLAREQYAHRKSLCLTQPAGRGADRRQARRRSLLTCADAPGYAFDGAGKNHARPHVERNVDGITGFHVAEVVLAEVRIDPGGADIDEGHDRLADTGVLPGRQAQVGDDAIRGRHNRRADQIEARLLQMLRPQRGSAGCPHPADRGSGAPPRAGHWPAQPRRPRPPAGASTSSPRAAA